MNHLNNGGKKTCYQGDGCYHGNGHYHSDGCYHGDGYGIRIKELPSRLPSHKLTSVHILYMMYVSVLVPCFSRSVMETLRLV